MGKPKWLRSHYSCPDCGQVYSIEEIKHLSSFNCKRCSAHYTNQDFHDENAEKWGFVPSLEEQEEQEILLERFLEEKGRRIEDLTD
jgi:hypothetical protein